MAQQERFMRIGSLLSFGVAIEMVVLGILLTRYYIWFSVTGHAQSWMQTSALFLVSLPNLLALCTILSAGIEIAKPSGGRFLNHCLLLSQVCVTLYLWPLLFSLESLSQQGGNRLILSAQAKSRLGLLQVFAPAPMYAPYGWTIAALIASLAVLLLAFASLLLRGKWKDAIGWPLIGMVAGFLLALS